MTSGNIPNVRGIYATTQISSLGKTDAKRCEVFEHGTDKTLGVFDSIKAVATKFLKNPQKAKNIARSAIKQGKTKAKIGDFHFYIKFID